MVKELLFDKNLIKCFLKLYFNLLYYMLLRNGKTVNYIADFSEFWNTKT